MSLIRADIFQLSYRIWWHSAPFSKALIEFIEANFKETFPIDSISKSGNKIIGDKEDPTKGFEFREEAIIFHVEVLENISIEIEFFQDIGFKLEEQILGYFNSNKLRFGHLHQDLIFHSKIKEKDAFKTVFGELGLDYGKEPVRFDFESDIDNIKTMSKVVVEVNNVPSLETVYLSENIHKEEDIKNHLRNSTEKLFT